MTTLYDLKPRFQNALRPIVARLARMGVSANAVTVAAIALSAIYGSLLAITHSKTGLILLGPVLLVRMGLNAIDGMLAREHHQASLLGAKLNEIGDVISDCCLYLPFALILAPAWPVILVIALGLLAEFAGIISLAYGGERDYSGPFGKSDRAAFFAFVALAEGVLSLPKMATAFLFLGAAVAGAITILNRLFGGAQLCTKQF
jgi:CDP-diacylglycerol--glycerol-3-phosphate 3-phosphatidyltransferase